MKREPFERVVERHGPTVLRVCRAVVGPVAADDAWSETFLAALTAYPALAPDSNVEAWLVTIAHRKAIDQIRLAARHPVPVGDLPDRLDRLDGPDRLDRPDWPVGSDPPAGIDEVALGHTLATLTPPSAGGLQAAAPDHDHRLDPWPAVLGLPLRQRQAVAYHHVAGLPYTDVAAILGCSVAAARRAASDGITALRNVFQQEES